MNCKNCGHGRRTDFGNCYHYNELFHAQTKCLGNPEEEGGSPESCGCTNPEPEGDNK